MRESVEYIKTANRNMINTNLIIGAIWLVGAISTEAYRKSLSMLAIGSMFIVFTILLIIVSAKDEEELEAIEDETKAIDNKIKKLKQRLL